MDPSLFEKLISPELLNFATQEGVRSKLKKWEKTLKMIKALLNDAEKKQQEVGAVKMWLDDLRDLAYDAEDILDEYATEALRRKLKIEEHQASTSRARKLIPACCIGCTPSDLWSDFSMRSKIDDVTRRLEALCRLRSELGLVEIAGVRSTALGVTRDTTCLPTEDVVYGRDQDKANIIKMVLKNEPGDANFGVIPIVGMGGIGKTTLVQEVYNDDAVKDFDPKAWVCVSDYFDVLQISNAIIRSITLLPIDYKDLNSVHVKLKELLNGKKFLLVLDDVWSDNAKSWQTLKSPFMFGALGSKVIVTTRLQEVALTLRPRGYYKLDHLSDDNCWSLFKKYAIEGRDNVARWNVELIRPKVVQKFQGLPLAARTLGGLLRCKDTEHEWMEILNSKIWELPGDILNSKIWDQPRADNNVLYGETRDTTCLPTEAVVYGRDQDKANIIEMVLNDELGDANFGVIPIVGMGGIGKTTLVQEVYNSDAVKDFDPKAWVCVYGNFDVLRISNAILRSITYPHSTVYKNLNSVHIKLKELLNGKKFLLVLDDVWSDKSWQTLKSPFMFGALGSKVIVTTRLPEVALTLRPRGYYKLDHLSDDNCWSLFKKYAFEGKDDVANWNLDMICEKVVQNCKGLPLAARTLGGLLRCKETEDEWIDILDSKIWDQPGADNVLSVLELSHPPSYLKRCFAYCSIFPKDYEFEMEELVLLWMAEGLVQQSGDDNQLEKLGGQYFHDLLSRSIFQISSSNNSKYIMHNLVNDLAQNAYENISFRSEYDLYSNSQSRISVKTRYASYICREYNHKSNFEVFSEAKNLRTHLSMPPVNSEEDSYYISNTVVPDLLLRFKKLRVLSLQKYYIVELPDSIGGLRLLKYLNLSGTRIRSLPESLNSMCNLQTLILRDCSKLWKWPCSMGNLIKLHHLDILGASSIKEMPMGVRKWKCLRTLSNFIVGKDSRSNLKDLKHLKILSGKLHISGLENVIDLEDILSDKKDLKVLLLEWGSRFDESRDKEVDKKVLDMLQPHQNLEKLKIKCYGGTEFSSWVGSSSFSKCKMTVLELVDCMKCTSLPSLGLLGSLKSLTVKGMNGVKSIGSEFYGEHCSNPFQSLETLYFENLEEWECWDPVKENESFPKLQELSIVNCPRLVERLPSNLCSLKKVVICKCEQLMVSLSNFPTLCDLKLDKCKMISWIGSADSRSLESMTLSNISYFGDWSRQELREVKSLEIEGCEELIELWQNEIFLEKLHSLFSLRKLRFKNCNTLTTLLEGIKQTNVQVEELTIENCNSLNSTFRGKLPQSLKKLNIEYCDKLQCLLDDNKDTCSSSSSKFQFPACLLPEENAVNTYTSHLEDLYIGGCPALTCLLSTDRLSITLTRLQIWDCSKLTTLSSTGQLPMLLKHIDIRRCSELTALLPKGQLPLTLETLTIYTCEKLEWIVEKFHNNKALCDIEIVRCRNLKSFPESLHTLSSLHLIKIEYCDDFASFPEGGFPDSNFTLVIKGCDKLEALPKSIFPSLEIHFCPNMSLLEEGLFTKLESLSISSVKQYKESLQLGLHNFTSLTDLYISGNLDRESLQEEEVKITLPRGLTSLRIGEFTKLKYLPLKGLEDLPCLESLIIGDCAELISLPSLPSSLLKVEISKCPLLKKACKRDKGKEWSKIADIPYVKIDNKFIYDPDEDSEA